MHEASVVARTDQAPVRGPVIVPPIISHSESKNPLDEPHSWAANLSGRRVDFPSPEGLAWGIEVNLPFDYIEKSALKSMYGVEIPTRITRFSVLTLDPQESLPAKLRTIRTNRSWIEGPTDLKTLASSTISGQFREKFFKAIAAPNRLADKQRRQTIEYIFKVVLGSNPQNVNRFNQLLATSQGNEVLVISGHGGKEPWAIGEQHSDEPESLPGEIHQKKRNSVLVTDLLAKYDQPEKYGIIMLFACYMGDQTLAHATKRVPVVRAIGKVGGKESLKERNPIEIVAPQNSTITE